MVERLSVLPVVGRSVQPHVPTRLMADLAVRRTHPPSAITVQNACRGDRIGSREPISEQARSRCPTGLLPLARRTLATEMIDEFCNSPTVITAHTVASACRR